MGRMSSTNTSLYCSNTQTKLICYFFKKRNLLRILSLLGNVIADEINKRVPKSTFDRFHCLVSVNVIPFTIKAGANEEERDNFCQFLRHEIDCGKVLRSTSNKESNTQMQKLFIYITTNTQWHRSSILIGMQTQSSKSHDVFACILYPRMY